MRKRIERKIAFAVIREGLRSGYSITVNEEVLKESINRKEILAAMFSTDEDVLIFHKDGKRTGWVQFVYGNSGWDVISDYSTSLEHIMTGANILADLYQ